MEGSSQRKFIDGIYQVIPEGKLKPQKKIYDLKIFKILAMILFIGLISFEFYKLFIPVSLIKAIPKMKNSLENTVKITKLLTQVFGFKGEKNYLILFQNSAELRPGGGFMGNYGLLSVKDGKIKNLKINDIYAMKWEHLNGQNISFTSYSPLSYISDEYSVHESNWNANFPDNARRVQRLYQLYGGPKTDGIIAFDPKIIEDILEIVGPIEMPEYGVILNEKNFRDEIQYKVEVDNPFKKYEDPTANPKKILQDFASLLMDKIKNASVDQKIQILQKIIQNLDEKHILLYANDEQIQNLISQNNWSGEIKETPRDYLAVINGNISATKSSLKTIETIKLSVNIFSNGSVINNLEITHDGKNLGGFLQHIDKSFVEVFTPKGSELLSVEYDNQKIPLGQIYIFEESGKTVFSFKALSIEPQEIKKLVFRYKLPLEVNKTNNIYSLLIQKQAGTYKNEISVQINLPEYLIFVNSNIQELDISADSVQYQTNLDTDKFLNLILQ